MMCRMYVCELETTWTHSPTTLKILLYMIIFIKCIIPIRGNVRKSNSNQFVAFSGTKHSYIVFDLNFTDSLWNPFSMTLESEQTAFTF